MKKWLFGLLCVVGVVVCLATGASAADGIPYAVTGGNIYFNANTGTITSFQDLGRLEESESQRLQAVERSERIFADFGSPG